IQSSEQRFAVRSGVSPHRSQEVDSNFNLIKPGTVPLELHAWRRLLTDVLRMFDCSISGPFQVFPPLWPQSADQFLVRLWVTLDNTVVLSNRCALKLLRCRRTCCQTDARHGTGCADVRSRAVCRDSVLPGHLTGPVRRAAEVLALSGCTTQENATGSAAWA